MPQATVATFNIRHGRGLDDRVDLGRTAEVIRRSGAELIALQELDRFNERSHGVDQPAELERLTGLKVSFAPTVARGGSEYGIALASREPLSDVEAVSLPRMGAEEPRKAIVASWRGLSVVATHLAWDPAANTAQQLALAEIARSRLPQALVMGDLNRTPRGLRALRDLGLTLARVRSGTIHPSWRFRRIDHVLLGPSFGLERARTVPTTASDHRPVVASVQWRVEDVLGVTYDV